MKSVFFLLLDRVKYHPNHFGHCQKTNEMLKSRNYSIPLGVTVCVVQYMALRMVKVMFDFQGTHMDRCSLCSECTVSNIG